MAAGAEVGGAAGRTQGLRESFCPLSRKLQKLAALVPEDVGPEGKDRGILELSQASPPRQPRRS